MKITVQPTDVCTSKCVVVDVLRNNLNSMYDERRFEWLYERNPHGQPRAWLAIDEMQDRPIGVAAAFPRSVYCDDKENTAWVLGDFCLEPQYRSLGPALQLQRACLAVMQGGKVDTFCYDFPSASMIAVYKRLGFNVIGKMFRLAKPLRVDRKSKAMIKNPAVQRVVTSVGNSLLKLTLPKVDVDESFEISTYEGLCGEEFTAFALEQRRNYGICVQRSAEYLNWRYLNNPLAPHDLVTARRDGHLLGYAVLTETEEDMAIVDLFGEEKVESVKSLVTNIMALACKRDHMTLSVTINESHPWLSLFVKLGFRLRESIPVVIIPSKAFPHKIDSQLTGWYLVQGDRDS